MEEKEKYYLISSDEDGIDIKEFENTDDLQKYFDRNFNPDEVITQPVFLDNVPNMVQGYFHYQEKNKFKENEEPLVLIKGKIIIPEPVTVVQKFKFE